MKRLLVLMFVALFAQAQAQVQIIQWSKAGTDDTVKMAGKNWGARVNFLTFFDGSKFTTAIGFYPFPNIADTIKYVEGLDSLKSAGYATRTMLQKDSLYRAAQEALKKDKADSVLAVGYYTNEKARVDTVNRNVLIALKKANSDSTLATGYYTNEKARVDTVNRNVLIGLRVAKVDTTTESPGSYFTATQAKTDSVNRNVLIGKRVAKVDTTTEAPGSYFTATQAKTDSVNRNVLIGKRIAYTDTSSVVANQWWVKDQIRDSLAEYALRANPVFTGTLSAGAGTFTGALSAPTLSLNSASVTTSILGVKGTNAKLNLQTWERGSSATAVARIDTAGKATFDSLKVNGTANIDNKVSITGANLGGNVVPLQVGNARASSRVELQIDGVVDKSASIKFTQSGVSKWVIGNGSAGDDNQFSIFNGVTGIEGIKIHNTTDVVTIAKNLVVSGTGNTTIAGNVGIGTTAPTGKLDVQAGLQLYAQRWLRTATGGTPVQVAAIDSNGYITAVKMTLDSMAYGGAYIADDNPDTLVFTVAGEFQTIGSRHATNPRGYPLTSGGVLKNVTVQDSSLTIAVDGTCNISWSISLESVTGVAANSKFNAYLYINNVKQEKSGSMRAMSGSSDCGQLVGTPMTYTLKKNDIIKLRLGNFDDANGNTVRALYAKVHLTRIVD